MLKDSRSNNNMLKIINLFFILSLSQLINSIELVDKLNIPPNFVIEILAKDLDSPRQMAETSSGHIIVGSKKGSEVIALVDADNDGEFEKQLVVANNLNNPAGVAYFEQDLYVAEMDTVWVIKNIDNWLDSNSKVLPDKEIYMNDLPSETWHGLKYIDFGPDGSLYIPIGVPCNICLEPQQEDPRFAAIHKYENGKLITIADGVRNSVGFDWHPVTKKLYFSDNGRDWLGDDSPACELNVVNKEGSFYGYPYKHAKDVIDPEFGDMIPSVNREFVDPIAELGAHVAPLGIAFYDGKAFPEKYRNSVFIALHGSWNRTKKSGYKVILVKLDDNGNYLYQEDFITGWLSNESAWGRPAAPFVMSDGSMLVSDDKYNVIFKVQYKG